MSSEPHFWGHRRRLRNRFVISGFKGMAEYEIVELLLTLAIPRSDVKKPAKQLISRFKNLRGILEAPKADIESITGLGKVAPIALHIIRETAALYLSQKSEGTDSFINPEYIYQYWRIKLGNQPNEIFQVAYLTSDYRLQHNGIETLEEGTIDKATIYPRKVIVSALRRGAAAIMCAHNHTNGNVQPTEHDKLLTRSLALAAATVQLKLIDHVVVTTDDVFSFRKEGLL